MPSHFHLLAGSEEVSANNSGTEPCESENPAGQLLQGAMKKIDTKENTTKNEGIYVLVKVSPIAP